MEFREERFLRAEGLADISSLADTHGSSSVSGLAWFSSFGTGVLRFNPSSFVLFLDPAEPRRDFDAPPRAPWRLVRPDVDASAVLPYQDGNRMALDGTGDSPPRRPLQPCKNAENNP